MEIKQNRSIPRIFIIVSVTLGLLLTAFSIASGNNPLVQPDLQTYRQYLQNSPVTAEQLGNWMVEGKRDFLLAGFRQKEECAAQKKITRLLKCYETEKASEPRWVRTTFRNIQMPLIVYGSETSDGLETAARLMHFGYNVRFLEGGFNNFADQILNPDLKTIDMAEADYQQLEQLALFRFFSGDDPMLKQKGQKWEMASADITTEEEEEGVELGESEEEDEEEEEEDEDEDEEEEEGC